MSILIHIANLPIIFLHAPRIHRKTNLSTAPYIKPTKPPIQPSSPNPSPSDTEWASERERENEEDREELQAQWKIRGEKRSEIRDGHEWITEEEGSRRQVHLGWWWLLSARDWVRICRSSWCQGPQLWRPRWDLHCLIMIIMSCVSVSFIFTRSWDLWDVNIEYFVWIKLFAGILYCSSVLLKKN